MKPTSQEARLTEILKANLDKMPGSALSNIPRVPAELQDRYPYLYKAIMDSMTEAASQEARQIILDFSRWLEDRVQDFYRWQIDEIKELSETYLTRFDAPTAAGDKEDILNSVMDWKAGYEGLMIRFKRIYQQNEELRQNAAGDNWIKLTYQVLEQNGFKLYNNTYYEKDIKVRGQFTIKMLVSLEYGKCVIGNQDIFCPKYLHELENIITAISGLPSLLQPQQNRIKNKL